MNRNGRATVLTKDGVTTTTHVDLATIGAGRHVPRGSQALPQRRLHEYFEAAADARPAATALVVDGVDLTYRQLDEAANRLAHHLLRSGYGPGARIGLRFRRSSTMYVALLAAQKAGGTFVPIDPDFPDDRVRYIVEDAGVDVVLTTTEFDAELGVTALALDDPALLRGVPEHRPGVSAEGDPVAYVIYTSGSSGRPKGVEVAQSSICNFIHVVTGLYNVTAGDRVYQGMSIAFDFSIEEIWPTWATGATLVAGPTDGRHLGGDLADFLDEAGVSVLYCVPTVLATIDRDLPRIHTLNVGGEACPQRLVERWGGPHRLMLNTYGPTEATVTCIYTELVPGRPVTIGFPLPTYELHLLNQNLEPVASGEMGEICIGGPGVAVGYIGRDDLNAEKFLTHPLVGGRVYRTGDLGRMTEWGVEYMGRADDEVKVRGKRVDLGEIEAQLRDCEGVNDAVVKLVKNDLAAYVTLHADADAITSTVAGRLRETLPAFMMPTTLRVMTAMPLMTSGKVDKKSLPDPGPRLITGSAEVVAAGTAMEKSVLAMWATALDLPEDDISITADFFTELSGHSLAAAVAVSGARKAFPKTGISIADLYDHPTVEMFAAYLDEVTAQTARDGQWSRAERGDTGWVALVRRLSAGAVQLGLLYGWLMLLALPVAVVYTDFDGILSTSLMWSLLTWMPIAYLAVRWLLPVVGIRLLSLGLRPGTYPLWGQVHLRTWAIRRLLEMSPATLFAGSPAMSTYLRLIGARVGRESHIATATVGVPSMLRVGDDVSIGYGVHLQPVQVRDGWLNLGTVVIENRAHIGNSSLLCGATIVGADGILSDHSVLEFGQSVPEGECHSGSPAVPDRRISPLLDDILAQGGRAPMRLSANLWGSFLLGVLVLEAVPFLALAPAVALVWWTMLTFGLGVGFLAAVVAGPLYVVSVCLVLALCRVLVVDETPEGVFPLASSLGLQRWYVDKLFEFSLILTNSLFATLYTPAWLRMLGAKIGTGSEVSTLAHVDPELLVIEDGGFVADMAHVGSAVTHRGYLAMSTTRVGSRAFVGNASFIPAGTELKTGSLIGVHTVAPTEVPQDTSWLGSPAIYLPQRQQSQVFDERLTFQPGPAQVAERLVFEFFRATLPATILGCGAYLALLVISLLSRGQPYSTVVPLTPLVLLGASCSAVLLTVAVKWVVIGRYQARVEPLWSRFVRRSELVTGLYEGAAVPALLHLLSGTPLLGPIMRLYGVKVGRGVYLDTTYITEFDLVELGDRASIGTGASLQTHLFEDRVMKMSTVRIGAGANVGDRAVVLYDAVVEEHATLGALSLVMKGEALPAGTPWLGVPARRQD